MMDAFITNLCSFMLIVGIVLCVVVHWGFFFLVPLAIAVVYYFSFARKG